MHVTFILKDLSEVFQGDIGDDYRACELAHDAVEQMVDGCYQQ